VCNKDIFIKSPLNYTGGKYKLLPQLTKYFPTDVYLFIDLFCGGCNVGVNINAPAIICIDNQTRIIKLQNTFKKYDKDYIIDTIKKIIEKNNLSNTAQNGYSYYNCNSSEGMGSYNKNMFLKMREGYNNRTEDNDYNDVLFFTILIYAFNNQVRFNKKGQCNIPVGKRDFNDKIRDNLSKFIDTIHTKSITFESKDFRELNMYQLPQNSFIYADPPYLITTATYNEQGGWNEQMEYDLLTLLDSINNKGVRFALSNLMESKGKTNGILEKWSKKYRVNYLDYNYQNSNYHKRDKSGKEIEVLITNY